MKALQGMVFDCDGVLFESRKANLAYYNSIFEVLGVPLIHSQDEERAHICHTACSRDVFRKILGDEKVELALASAARLDYRQFIPLMSPEPEMVKVLTLLSRRYPLAMATNRGSSAMAILQHFGLLDLFTEVVTVQDVKRPKPYPDMLEMALDRLGLQADEALYVGDSNLDRLAASEARICFMAYKGVGEGDVVVESFDELYSWVESFNSTL